MRSKLFSNPNVLCGLITLCQPVKENQSPVLLFKHSQKLI